MVITAASGAAPASRNRDDFTVAEFKQMARIGGWTFWRGVLIGFVAAFPIAYLALVGEKLLGFGG
jgi:hypothetical protein